MALLTEEIVQEWLNRQGYFTIRGIKVGVNEIDLLAIKPLTNGGVDCRHVEVQCSINPVSYISSVSKKVQKETGRASRSAKERNHDDLVEGVQEWITKKFDGKKKSVLKMSLCPYSWSKELVINVVKHGNEVSLIEQNGVKVHTLKSIVFDLNHNHGIIKSACGGDLSNLLMVGESK